MTDKPLFIPLRTKHFADFEVGTKTVEYRQHKRQWNLRNVRVGRPVVLSLGYNQGKRLSGDVEVICIGIRKDQEV